MDVRLVLALKQSEIPKGLLVFMTSSKVKQALGQPSTPLPLSSLISWHSVALPEGMCVSMDADGP